MSYESITPLYYKTFQQNTPLHAGAPGWMSAPFPGWGENPNLAGQRMLATDGLGNVILTNPVVDFPLGMDESQKRRVMWLAWASALGALAYFGMKRGGFLRTMARNAGLGGKAVPSYDPRKSEIVAAIKRKYNCRKVTDVRDHGGGVFSGTVHNRGVSSETTEGGRGTVQL